MRYLYLILFFTFSSILISDEISDLLDKLPPIMNKNNVGIEYWLTVIPGLSDNNGIENTVKIFASSFTETNVTVEIPGKAFKQVKKVQLGEVIEFNISPSIAQPYTKSSTEPVFGSDIFKNTGIRVTSESPIIVYVLVRNGNSSDGYLAYPVSSLANEYIVSSINDASSYYPIYNSLPSLSGIVAAYDGTEVTFTMGGNNSSQTSGGTKPDESITKYLNKGDVWMISSKGNDADLTGSRIKSNYPVSVISGNQCANIPIANKFCDYITEMETPINTWSDTYFIPRIYGRKFNSVLRVFAKENNTNIYVNGQLKGNIAKAGGKIYDGFLEFRTNTTTSSADIITADKPISVTLYNTGVEEDGFPEPPGDPFQMILSPLTQFQKVIQLAVPASPAGQKYNSNYLTLIFEKTTDVMPDNIEFGTQTKSGIIYQNLNTITPLLNEEFSYQLNGKKYYHLVYKLPQYGVFTLSSPLPFVAYLYGFSSNDSYGMPAGLDLLSLEKEDATAPEVTYQILCDGSIQGTTKDKPENSTVRSNLAGWVFYSDFSENYVKGECDQIITNETVTMNWNLNIVDKKKDAKALMQFWDGKSNFSNIAIIYKAPKISINTNYENYGYFKINESSSRTFTLKNIGQKTVTLNKLNLKSNVQGFKIITSIPQSIELNPQQEFAFDVEFKSPQSGKFIDSIGFGSDCLFSYYTHIEANVGNPVIIADDVSFGDVTVNKSVIEKVFIHNAGSSDLVISNFKPTFNSVFKINFGREISPSNKLIINPNDKFDFTIEFKPINEQVYSDSIVFMSDANTIDSITYINGRGIKEGLAATSYNWLRKPIHRTEFPSGPYPIVSLDSGIVIQNTGLEDIKINNIEIIEDINGNAFEFNRQQFVNLTIKSGDSYKFKVNFRPTNQGEHLLKIKYNDDKLLNTISELRGFGTVPKINDETIDFGSIISGNSEKPEIRTITIKNLSVSEWQFADTVVIQDLFHNEEISDEIDKYGTYGFKYDKSKVGLPIKLAPSETITFDVYFAPENDGNYSSVIKVLSTALSNSNLFLNGSASNQNIQIINGEGIACINNSELISAKIINNGTKPFKASKLEFLNNENEFVLEDNSILDGFEIQPKQTQLVTLSFKPESIIQKSIDFQFFDEENPTIKKIGQIVGRTKIDQPELVITPVSQIIEIGKKVEIKCRLDYNLDLSSIPMGEIQIKLSYNNAVLLPDLSSLKIGNNLIGKYTISKPEIDNTSEISFRLNSIADQNIVGNENIFSIQFDTYFANDTFNYSDIEVIAISSNSCIQFKNGRSRIETVPVCVDELRKLKFSEFNFQILKVSPNPVVGNSISINYSVPFDTYTSISLFNVFGEEIKLLDNSFVSKGIHNKNISLENIGSGIYFIKMQCGSVTKLEKFILE